MIVKDLIDDLKKMPQDKEVRSFDDNCRSMVPTQVICGCHVLDFGGLTLDGVNKCVVVYHDQPKK